MHKASIRFIIFLIAVNSVSPSQPVESTYLSLEKLKTTQGFGEHDWRYHAGDDPAWVHPDFDDSKWELARTELQTYNMPSGGWQGIGWFRLHLDVDSTLWHAPLIMQMSQAGYSEIYLDGMLINASEDDGSGKPNDNLPVHRQFPTFSFDGKSNHVIAIRYSNHSTETFHNTSLLAGFALSLGRADVIMERWQRRQEMLLGIQIFLTTVALSFAVLHLILFLFSPQAKSNLYFALFAVLFAGNIFFDYQIVLAQDIRSSLSALRIHRAIVSINPALTLLFLYSVFESKLPRQFWIITLGLIVAGVLAVLSPITNLFYAQMAGLVGAIEAVRELRLAILRKRDGAWIIAVGFILLFFFSAYDALLDLDLMEPIHDINNAYPIGFLGLIVSMSVYLSRDFARRNEKLLEQERQAKELEIQQRLLSADNARKTKELEDARQLQLSMLPKQIPSLPHLDIAVEMRTATEVGGDYYDFHLAEDGMLTVALGDATGHGMRAGTMVSVAKALFHELATHPHIPTMFERFTQGIKAMNFSQLYMALMLVRIKNHTLEASAAGMPPMLVYRATTQRVETVMMKGMPLGQFDGFPYQTKALALSPGDTILLMSDGLIEMFNDKNETFDEGRVVGAFTNVGSRSPKKIINHLVEEGEKWADGKPQADDVTFVVMKVK